MAEPDEDAFLDCLYAAAAEPGQWKSVLEQLADMVGGSSVWLSRLSVIDGTGSGVLSRIDPAMAERYEAHFAACNPLNNVRDPEAYWRSWRPLVLTDEDWMPKSALVRSEYYNDFLRPQEIHTTMMIRLAAHRPQTSVININRGLAGGAFARRDIERVERLHPHLIRAFRLSQRFASLRGLAADTAAALDQAPYGVFVLEDDGRVRHANDAGERMATPGGVLRVVDGCLTAADPGTAGRLTGLIAAAASPEPSARRAGSLSIATGAGNAAITVTVAPQKSGPLAVFVERPCVVVCVWDPHGRALRDIDGLRELYGFTPAEARVAMAIGEGLSPRQVAQRLGVSFHTVRHQLQTVFEKAGVNRQAELLLKLRRATDANGR